jgi:hypothetical protein
MLMLRAAIQCQIAHQVVAACTCSLCVNCAVPQYDSLLRAMMAADVHDLDRYRAGCRCAVCKAANRDYMRLYRSEKRGLSEPAPLPDSPEASVTVLPRPVLVEDFVTGPNEQAVLDETATLSAAARRPTSVQSALTMARGLDNRKLATQHAAMVRQLEAVMASLRAASTVRAGRLAAVAKLSQRPISGVG